MTEALVVLCACGAEPEALALGKALVEERLAACANVLPGVQSIYRWKGTVETASEYMLVIKTSQSRFAALRDRISQLHSYAVPEIIAIPVIDGEEKYLAWIRENV